MKNSRLRNVQGCILLMEYVITFIRNRVFLQGGDGGRVINIASMAGLFAGLTEFDGLGYGVSKWGAVSFTM